MTSRLTHYCATASENVTPTATGAAAGAKDAGQRVGQGQSALYDGLGSGSGPGLGDIVSPLGPGVGEREAGWVAPPWGAMN